MRKSCVPVRPPFPRAPPPPGRLPRSAFVLHGGPRAAAPPAASTCSATMACRGASLGSKWRVGDRLGSGACAEVYECTPVSNNSTFRRMLKPGMAFVVKMTAMPKATGKKAKKGKPSEQKLMADLLFKEHMLYHNLLNNSALLPSEGPYGYGEANGYRYLVMERLGATLDQRLEQEGGRLPPALLSKVGLDLLQCFEALHRHGYVFVDVKPENVMLGRWDADADRLVSPDRATLIDFGIAAQWRNHKGEHVEEGGGAEPNGTPRFLGLSVHLRGTSPCRRDDLEALGHMLIACAAGNALPWDEASTSEEATKAAKEAAGSGQDICRSLQLSPSLSAPLSSFLDACRALSHAEKPPYARLRALLEALARAEASAAPRAPKRARKAPAKPKSKAAGGRRAAAAPEVVDLSAEEEAAAAPARKRSRAEAKDPRAAEAVAVRVVRGPHVGEEKALEMEDGAVLFIGKRAKRGAAASLSLPKDALVSTAHAVLRVEGAAPGGARATRRTRRKAEPQRLSVTFADVGSTNGSFVDGERVDPHSPRRLEGACTIGIGHDTEIRVVVPQ